MLYFLSDYTEGAHPQVLQHLVDVNMVSLPGYGCDEHTEAAKAKICAACGKDDLQIQFLAGGTQTNQVAIDSMLRSYEGVVCADTGHINVHEAGAIEYSGHRVLALPQVQGKLMAAELAKFMDSFCSDENREHLVQPGLVYISHPTEYGTLYTKQELTELSACCHKYGLNLYMDGARLGYGLMSPVTDVTLQDIVELCDLFYIGGTKVGALCGEALIFTHQNMPAHFLTITKQHGALLAKTRVVSQQFDALFTDDLYFKISRHALDMAMKLKAACLEKGYELLMDSPTNQQFIILTPAQLNALRENVQFNIWENLPDGRIAIRLATSWSTREEDVDALINLL
jgi:threonine aldolase